MLFKRKVATTGTYYWSRGSSFVTSAYEMIAANDRTNNEFYVCPTYNYLICKGMRVVPFPVILHESLGTPEELKEYLNKPWR
jgi:hypothetical protein